MFLQNPFVGAFAIDMGDLSIKLVQLQRRWSLKTRQQFFDVKEMRSISLPPGYIVNGEIQQPEMVRKKLLQLIGRDHIYKPIKSVWTVVDLPEPKTFLKLIAIDIPPEQLTAEDVVFHAKKHLPFDLEETYFDWQIVELPTEEQNKSGVLIGAVPKVISDSYTYLMESVGLGVMALEIEAIAIARALITANKDYTGEARALLDIGATRSSLIIYDHGNIQVSINLNFSGSLLTTAISQDLKIDYDAAEQLKIQNGLAIDPIHPRYLKVVSDQVENFTREISNALSFYKEHFSAPNPVTHITMCGGGSNLKNLDGLLARKLKISARPGNAWKNLFNPKYGDADRIRGLSWASAIGMSLRAAHSIFENCDQPYGKQ